ncbi:MAG: TIGR01777 family oxidoreductase [bacterium]
MYLRQAVARVHVAETKVRIWDSRIKGTRLLCETLAQLKNPPKVLVCASAIGFYGDRGDEKLDEESDSGSGFLADLCVKWEAACEAAGKKGIRVVNLRFGLVLSAAGGALAKMLFPFKMGVGGIVGNGKQYWSWIALTDVVGAILHALVSESLSGAVNAVAPNPSTNREFTRTLGRVLKRPTILPMPALSVRLAFGEMGEELLLSSARVEPAKLTSSSFKFQFSQLEGALRDVLGKVGA